MKKIISIISIIFVIAIFAFVGYEGYQKYQDWKTAGETKTASQELRLIELLNDNQEAIVKLYTKIAVVEKRIIGETLKETTVIKEDAETYNELKDELIELRKDGEANKEKIETMRAEFEERIEEYRASSDKILINTGEEKIVIYEDQEGNLVSLDSGIKITRHRKAEEVIEDLKAGVTIEGEEKKYEMAFSMIYDLDQRSYTPGISYELLDWRNFGLNITGYDFENIKGGLDLCYNIKEKIVVGAGIRIFELEDFQFNIDKYYLKAGIEFSF